MKITIETQDKKTIAKINEVLPQFLEFITGKLPKEPKPHTNPTFTSNKFELDERYLSTGTINALKLEGIYTLHQLTRYSATELLRKPRFGTKALEEVRDLLAGYRGKLKDD